jgi:outer membrane lipoprotein-sorting protein
MKDETRAIHEFDRFLDDLMLDPDVPTPVTSELPAEEVAWARQFVRGYKSLAPSATEEAAAQARVWRKVLADASNAKRAPGWADRWRALFQPASGRLWLRVGMTFAALVLAIAVGLYITASQPTPVSAQEILTRAEGTLISAGDRGVQSFVLTETQRTVPGNLRLNAFARLKGDESFLTEVQRWYQSPNQWRSEYVQKVVTPDGKVVRSERSVHVSDGKNLWQYIQRDNLVTVDPLDPRMDVRGEGGLFGQYAETLRELFSQVESCYDPKLKENATIAGRSAYVVDLGATKCPSASGPEMQGRIIIWVDQETSFVLKTEQHDKFTDQVIVTNQVTNVQYNVEVDPARFVFTPPAGATVQDNR